MLGKIALKIRKSLFLLATPSRLTCSSVLNLDFSVISVWPCVGHLENTRSSSIAIIEFNFLQFCLLYILTGLKIRQVILTCYSNSDRNVYTVCDLFQIQTNQPSQMSTDILCYKGQAVLPSLHYVEATIGHRQFTKAFCLCNKSFAFMKLCQQLWGDKLSVNGIPYYIVVRPLLTDGDRKVTSTISLTPI